MNKEKQIDDLVALLDNFMSNNGGHMNVTVDDSGNIQTDGETVEEASIKTMNSLDCASGDLACQVPTLFEGMDNED